MKCPACHSDFKPEELSCTLRAFLDEETTAEYKEENNDLWFTVSDDWSWAVQCTECLHTFDIDYEKHYVGGPNLSTPIDYDRNIILCSD